jgi:hypothetical protein
MREDTNLLLGSLMAVLVAVLFGACLWITLNARAPRNADLSPSTINNAEREPALLSFPQDHRVRHDAQTAF